MTLYTQPNLTSGIDTALVSTAQSVKTFPIMILLFTFMVVLLGGTSNQRRRTGQADYPFWTALASLTIMFESLLMTIGERLINITTLGVVVAITIMSAFWFFMSKQRGEI